MSRNPFSSTAVGSWTLWTLGFLAFPLAGLAGKAVGGPVDSLTAAIVGGLATGAVIGAGQWLASGRRLAPARWIPATAIGMGAGLAAGAVAVDFGTSLTDLAVMGAITGLFLGLAQALALAGPALQRVMWGASMPVLWALGWTVTTVAGVDVVAQYTVFGATGAITFSALSGLLMLVVLPRAVISNSAPTVAASTS
jgi:hypothetical protein